MAKVFGIGSQPAPDVLGLQEVKAEVGQVADAERLFDGYECVWNSARTKRIFRYGVLCETCTAADGFGLAR